MAIHQKTGLMGMYQHWSVLRGRWPVLLALTATIPAFYIELLDGSPSPLAAAAYALAAAVVTGNEWLGTRRARTAVRGRPISTPRLMIVVSLVVGLLLAAALPPSLGSPAALAVRGGTAMLTLIYMVWSMQRLFERRSLPVVLLLALTVLALCGGGFWWLEPQAPTLADGLWLAFVTAATVGYGDIVPTTPASKIFAVFVVLLGWGVLTLVTAAISSMWVESSERRLERDILHDLHQEVGQLRHELRALRADVLHAQADARARHADAAPVPVASSVDDR